MKQDQLIEWFFTYGWVMLVVMVAVGALAYFGFYHPSRFILENPCVLNTIAEGAFTQELGEQLGQPFTLDSPNAQSVLYGDVVTCVWRGRLQTHGIEIPFLVTRNFTRP